MTWWTVTSRGAGLGWPGCVAWGQALQMRETRRPTYCRILSMCFQGPTCQALPRRLSSDRWEPRGQDPPIPSSSKSIASVWTYHGPRRGSGGQLGSCPTHPRSLRGGTRVRAIRGPCCGWMRRVSELTWWSSLPARGHPLAVSPGLLMWQFLPPEAPLGHDGLAISASQVP